MSLRDFGLLLFLAAIWGASFLFMRVATPEFGPLPLIALRMSLGALILLPFLSSAHARREVVKHGWALASSGLLSSGLPFLLLSYSTLYLSAGFTSLMNGSVPIFSAIIGAIWLREPMGRGRIFGLVLGLTGLVVLVGDKLDFSGQGTGLAVLAALTACFLYGYGANFIKRFLTQVPPRVASAGSLFWAALVLMPLGIWQVPSEVPSFQAWLSALLLAGLCTGVAFIFFFGLLQRVGPVSTTTVAYLIPAFGIFWGWLILDEQVTTRMVAGMILSLLGTTFVTGFWRGRGFRRRGQSSQSGPN